MDIVEITDLLDTVPTGRTRFELEYFTLEAYPTSSRQLVAAMREIEELDARLKVWTERMANETSEGELMFMHREKKVIEQQLSQLAEWYDRINPSMRSEILKCFESEEPEYWATYLGRQAAIELLTIGKTTKDTMDKMASLPEETFEDAVRVCIRYAAMIKETTMMVESSVGIETRGVPTE
jgi:hypothetical protein